MPTPCDTVSDSNREITLGAHLSIDGRLTANGHHLKGLSHMRQMTRLATVGAMSLALVGASASAALAGYHEFSSEETFTNIDQCVVVQQLEAGGLTLPDIIPPDLLGGSAYNCIGNEVVVVVNE